MSLGGSRWGLNSFQVGRHYRAGTQRVQSGRPAGLVRGIREKGKGGSRSLVPARRRGRRVDTKEKDTRVGAKKRSPGRLWRGVAEESARSRTPTKWFKTLTDRGTVRRNSQGAPSTWLEPNWGGPNWRQRFSIDTSPKSTNFRTFVIFNLRTDDFLICVVDL